MKPSSILDEFSEYQRLKRYREYCEVVHGIDETQHPWDPIAWTGWRTPKRLYDEEHIDNGHILQQPLADRVAADFLNSLPHDSLEGYRDGLADDSEQTRMDSANHLLSEINESADCHFSNQLFTPQSTLQLILNDATNEGLDDETRDAAFHAALCFINEKLTYFEEDPESNTETETMNTNPSEHLSSQATNNQRTEKTFTHPNQVTVSRTLLTMCREAMRSDAPQAIRDALIKSIDEILT